MLTPKIVKGTYECSTAYDANIQISEVIYLEDAPYIKIKALVTPKSLEGLFIGETEEKWYTVPIENTENWKKKGKREK